MEETKTKQKSILCDANEHKQPNWTEYGIRFVCAEEKKIKLINSHIRNKKNCYTELKKKKMKDTIKSDYFLNEQMNLKCWMGRKKSKEVENKNGKGD